MLIAGWGPTTLYLNGAPALDAESEGSLAGRGVEIEPAGIEALEGDRCTLMAALLKPSLPRPTRTIAEAQVDLFRALGGGWQ